MKKSIAIVIAAAWGLISPHSIAQSNYPTLLSIGAGNNNNALTLSWSNTAPGFVLESVTSLPPAQPWSGILQSPQVIGNHMTVTQTPTAAAMFYRLVAKGNPAGFDYLLANQNADGSWGASSLTPFRDTEAVLDMLALLGQTNTSSYYAGLWAMAAATPRNNDDLCRQIIAVTAAGQDMSYQTTNLLASQNLEILDVSNTNYPGRGWGLAGGFGNSTLDTALALRSLNTVGKTAGLSVVSETLAGSAVSSPRTFSVPVGATNLTLKVRKLTGTVRFRITYPDSSSSYIDLSAAQVPVVVGFPTVTSNLSFTAENRTTSSANYTAEVGYTGPDGFDTFIVTTALSYLGLAQNADGGWGIAPGQDSQLMVTAEVTRSLAAWGAAFSDTQASQAAVTWLLSHQNPDGGFSSETNNSNPYETSLAILAIHLANPSASLASATAFLKNAQLSDGSWGSSAYQTALAMQARRLPPIVSQIPGQSVVSPAAFASINLDNYVTDADGSPTQIVWQVTGNSQISVNISNRIASFSYPAGTNITEQLTFIATDPDGYTGSSTATFTAAYQLVDYTIARGGSATGSRSFTGSATVLNQAAYYTEVHSNFPPNLTYTTTSFSRTSSTAFTVGYTISAATNMTTGLYGFSVIYGLEDSSYNALGPLTNNVFNFTIQVTP